jgi:uncharacterized protein YbdZ (MbtH family)
MLTRIVRDGGYIKRERESPSWYLVPLLTRVLRGAQPQGHPYRDEERCGVLGIPPTGGDRTVTGVPGGKATVGLVGVCSRGPPFGRQNSRRFLSITSEARRIWPQVANGWSVVCITQKREGCHENQDECEGWTTHSNPLKRRETQARLPNQKGKESSHENQDERKGRLNYPLTSPNNSFKPWGI